MLTSESDAPLPFEPEFVAAELVEGGEGLGAGEDEELGAGDGELVSDDEVDRGLGAGVSDEVDGTGVELDVELVETEVEEVIGVLENADVFEVLGLDVALDIVEVLTVVIEKFTGILDSIDVVVINDELDSAAGLDSLLVNGPPPRTMLSDVELDPAISL